MLGKCAALGDPGRSGLPPAELRALLETLFPGALDDTSAELEALRPQLQAYEARGLDDPQPGFSLLLRVLLETWSAPELDTTPLVSSVLTRACLRPDHLWRDLGLSGREDVTALLTRHYPDWRRATCATCVGSNTWPMPPANMPGCRLPPRPAVRAARTMNIATAARRPDCAAPPGRALARGDRSGSRAPPGIGSNTRHGHDARH